MSKIVLSFIQTETESRGSTHRRAGTVPTVKVEKKEDEGDARGEEGAEDDPQPGPSVKIEPGAAQQGGMLKPEPGVVYKPLSIRVDKADGKIAYKYKCPLCLVDRVMASKNGMWAHINEIHLQRALLCTMCDSTFFNPDSLMRHERKEHKK